jgi:hypothetical protein
VQELIDTCISRSAAGAHRVLANTVHARRYVLVCNDDEVTYKWDEQASKEAADYPVSAPETDMLRRQCSRKAAGLGLDGVRSHTVSFPVTAWDEPPGLPEGVSRSGHISRGDVLDIGQQARAQARPATDLLVASFIWGWGAVGYGPRRLRDIRAAAGNQLKPSLQVNRSTVKKWRARFLARRLDGLGDEPRPGVPRTITDAQVEEVIVRTLEETPEGATH